MDTIQISIEATEEEQEILISKLEDFNTKGFEQTSNYLLAYFNENDFSAYDIKQIIKFFSYQITTIKDRNWNDVWESNFSPVIIDDYCLIRAEFHESDKTLPIEIIITPKMSFGTGHHPTTHMMISMMRKLDFKGKEVFDFGTGTGILAILAEKSGAKKVFATDSDSWSIENCRENVLKNECKNIIIEQTDKLPDHSFDIILANINKNVILNYIPQLKKILKRGGFLLLSGILNTDEMDLSNACKSVSITLSKKVEIITWICLLFID